MRRLLAVALAVTAGCSPAQEQAWMRWFHRHPKAATHWAIHECAELCTDDWDRDGIVEPEPAATPESGSSDTLDGEPAPSPLGGACSQWADTALAVGWSPSDWPTLDAILWQESRCDPSAYNPTEHFGGHASGLAQIIWPTWAGECGISDPFDPWQNLSCALYLKTHYGWSQWAGF